MTENIPLSAILQDPSVLNTGENGRRETHNVAAPASQNRAPTTPPSRIEHYSATAQQQARISRPPITRLGVARKPPNQDITNVNPAHGGGWVAHDPVLFDANVPKFATELAAEIQAGASAPPPPRQQGRNAGNGRGLAAANGPKGVVKPGSNRSDHWRAASHQKGLRQTRPGPSKTASRSTSAVNELYSRYPHAYAGYDRALRALEASAAVWQIEASPNDAKSNRTSVAVPLSSPRAFNRDDGGHGR